MPQNTTILLTVNIFVSMISITIRSTANDVANNDNASDRLPGLALKNTLYYEDQSDIIHTWNTQTTNNIEKIIS